jgi:hypothetical protein
MCKVENIHILVYAKYVAIYMEYIEHYTCIMRNNMHSIHEKEYIYFMEYYIDCIQYNMHTIYVKVCII